MLTVQSWKLVRYFQLAMTLVSPNAGETFGNEVLTIHKASVPPPNNVVGVFTGVGGVIVVELF